MMKTDVEQRLGVRIDDTIFEKAKSAAKLKRYMIIQEHGDAEGKRLSEDYFLQLVVEEVKTEIIADAMLLVNGNEINMKKSAPHNTASTPTKHIISRPAFQGKESSYNGKSNISKVTGSISIQ